MYRGKMIWIMNDISLKNIAKSDFNEKKLVGLKFYIQGKYISKVKVK
jgi:hypothetical protein